MPHITLDLLLMPPGMETPPDLVDAPASVRDAHERAWYSYRRSTPPPNARTSVCRRGYRELWDYWDQEDLAALETALYQRGFRWEHEGRHRWETLTPFIDVAQTWSLLDRGRVWQWVRVAERVGNDWRPAPPACLSVCPNEI